MTVVCWNPAVIASDLDIEIPIRTNTRTHQLGQQNKYKLIPYLHEILLKKNNYFITNQINLSMNIQFTNISILLNLTYGGLL